MHYSTTAAEKKEKAELKKRELEITALQEDLGIKRGVFLFLESSGFPSQILFAVRLLVQGGVYYSDTALG